MTAEQRPPGNQPDFDVSNIFRKRIYHERVGTMRAVSPFGASTFPSETRLDRLGPPLAGTTQECREPRSPGRHPERSKTWQ
jgi:hypothetical protein